MRSGRTIFGTHQYFKGLIYKYVLSPELHSISFVNLKKMQCDAAIMTRVRKKRNTTTTYNNDDDYYFKLEKS